MNETLFDRLVRSCGVQSRYLDVWGRAHEASRETLQAVLAAMGVAAQTDDEIAAALDERESASWHRTLPAVHIVADDGPVEVPLVFPASMRAHRTIWTLILERGERHSSALQVADLPVDEVRRHGAIDFVRARLPLPRKLPPGYHRLALRDEAGEVLGEAMLLAVAPPRCFEPPALQNRGRVWGWSVQLYGVRSARNWGMGDFGDLMRLVELAAALGAGVIGVNPLHALFPARPAQISPYSPSHRAFINPLYLDIEGLDDCNESAAARQRIANPHFDARLQELRARELVDHVGVAAAKWPMLELCYEHFRTQHLDRNSPRAQAFRQYQEERGQTLHRYALHDALHEHFLGRDAHLWGWPVWPESYRTPDAQAVEEFAVKHADRIQFFEYAQWQCELQLERVAARARELNLAIGLYFDVAIGVDRGGAETWSEQSAYALHASAGAPPDEYNVNGQDWGLPPLIPERLRGAAYRPFVATLDASMRHAGAVRLDHVMALQRLYWVPSLHKASAGAYVEYPLRDLLALLALESRRRRCLVVGEDLGTVAPEVRRALHDAGVLSYRPLYFEKNEDGSFTRPSGYPARALCSLGTHDLPTLRGYWSANDVEWRRKLGLYPSEEVELAQFAARARDRIEFARALQREGLLPASDAPLDWSPQVTLAAYEFLARTPCKVLLVQPEDVFGELEQANLPGTVDEHPNWRRKLPLPLEQWERHAALLELAARLRAARPG